MSKELKPCPFCGGEAKFGTVNEGENFGGEFIECSNATCGCSTCLMFPAMEGVKPLLAEKWNRRTEAAQDKFAPFQRWDDDGGLYGLCVDYNGNIIDPPEGADYIEYRLCADGNDRWLLEVSDSAETREEVYRGRIPTRSFFVELMRNIEAAVILPTVSTATAQSAGGEQP